VHGLPNDLGHPRLGLSVSRRVGKAHRRNRIKRLLREAFRLEQHNLVGSLDLIIVVTPHEPRPLDDYRNLLIDAARQLDAHWSKKQRDTPAASTDKT
jgi:ribonuclease P protein component